MSDQLINFEYHIPTKIYFGPNEFVHLGEEVALYGKTVLVTYGGGSIKKIGLYDAVMDQLREHGMTVIEMGGIEPNPRIESVRKGADLCKEHNVDVVLAVGGGSTIDCSKFICAAALTDEDSWTWFVHGGSSIKRALPLVTVLTLAATGSEMDNGGVITNLATNEKLGSGSPLLLPRASFLNPENTYTVSAFQTAAGSADIMSHTMEVYFTQEQDLYFLDTFMEGLLRTVIKYAPLAIAEPAHYEARANLMWASTWAINGFTKGGKLHDWSVHPIEHELSGYYDITHGLGLAILTPQWLRFVLAKDPEHTVEKITQFARSVFLVDGAGKSELEIAHEGIDALERFFVKDLGLAPDLSSLDINDEHFKTMAKHALKGKDCLHGFIDLNAADIEEIYRMSVDRKSEFLTDKLVGALSHL